MLKQRIKELAQVYKLDEAFADEHLRCPCCKEVILKGESYSKGAKGEVLCWDCLNTFDVIEGQLLRAGVIKPVYDH